MCTAKCEDFGLIPLNPLVLYQGGNVHREKIPDIFIAHKLIRQSGVPNFLRCRIPIETAFNLEAWRTHLVDYWDRQLPDLIQFGFP